MQAVGAVVVVMLLAATSGCLGGQPPETSGNGPAGSDGPVDASNVSISLDMIADGFAQPILVVSAVDGSGDLYVVERQGRVMVIEAAAVRAEPLLDITDRVGASGSEQGLLGLAFDPKGSDPAYAIVSYTDGTGASILSRFEFEAGPPTRLDPSSEEILLTVAQPASNHNGGHVAFGPDGFLYVGLGDGGGSGDTYANAQNPLTLLGSLLRIDVSGASGYSVPGDNPFVDDASAADEIWAYGLRNPWRFSFDTQTGDLFIGDVGQDAWEEVDHQPASSPGGENYGWNVFEGHEPFRPGLASETDTVMPVAVYANTPGQYVGKCSVTGGFVYRGTDVAGLSGRYVFGDFCAGTIWTLEPDGNDWTMEILLESGMNVASFGQDEDGEVYLVDYAGGIYRFAQIAG